MNNEQDQLARQWSAITEGAGAAIEWVEQVRGNSRRLTSEADDLVRRLRQVRNKGKDLKRAAGTPMTIGFFGVSQAGKSYLISALGAGSNGKFETVYGGQRVDFLAHVNPPGSGSESTGLVTRFTRQARAAEDAAFPVEVRLFREVDLAKILSNAWFNDFDQNKVEYRLDEARIDHVLARFEGHEEGPPQGGLDADDVVSLWDYVNASFEKPVRPLENGYWQRALQLAPRLAPDERAALFSVLWGELPELTRAYADIAASLGRLGHAEAAFLPLDALACDVDGKLQYSPNSIMSVAALMNQGGAKDKTIAVRARAGGRLAPATGIPISHLAALTAELVFPLVEPTRQESVESVDLLDFPGYRGRYKASGIADISAEQNPVAQLLLRGKVAYLFESYTDAQAMNGLVLCTHEQSDVSDIAKVLERWVEHTQGDTPQARGQRACGLFWAITKFDLRLQNLLRMEGDTLVSKSWGDMIHGTMEERYGQLGFMQAWSASGGQEQAFNNVFLVRKPGIETTFIRLQNGTEVMDADKQTGLARLGQAFVEHEAVRMRVADPQAAWDAVLATDDGGMGRLAAAISGIADIAFKLGRLRQQLDDERDREHGILARLAKYHQDIDGEDVEKKKRLGSTLAQALYSARKALPELMHAMELPREDLRDLYLNGLHRHPENAARPSTDKDVAAPEINPFATPGGDEHNPFAQAANPAAAPVKTVRKTVDHLYAEAVFQRWVAHLRGLPARRRLLAFLGVQEGIAEALVEELITAANRLNLQDKLLAALLGHQDSSSRREHLVMRQVLRVQMTLHDFIAWLGYADVAPQDRPVGMVNGQKLFTNTTRLDSADLPDLDNEPADITTEYAGYWLTGLRDLVQHNAGHAAGSEITLDQNQALGRIIDSFRQA